MEEPVPQAVIFIEGDVCPDFFDTDLEAPHISIFSVDPTIKKVVDALIRSRAGALGGEAAGLAGL